MSEFTKNISPMAIAEDFIKGTEAYSSLLSKGLDEKQAIRSCLEQLGMDMQDVSMNKGIIRTHKNKRQGYVGNVYIGMTRPDYPHKYMYDYVQVLSPDYVPEGKDTIDLEMIGCDFSEEPQAIEELKAQQVADRKSDNKRQVRTPKFKPEKDKVVSVDKIIRRKLK